MKARWNQQLLDYLTVKFRKMAETSPGKLVEVKEQGSEGTQHTQRAVKRKREEDGAQSATDNRAKTRKVAKRKS